MSKNQKKKAAALFVFAAFYKQHLDEEEALKNKRAVRRAWVLEWLQKRPMYGAHNNVMQEFREIESQKHLYNNFLRMSESCFIELLQMVTPLIQKQDTNMRMAISPSERLAVTLRFLATGDSFKSLSILFRIAPCTISNIVPEVCDAIYSVLKENYMQVPSTNEQWKAVAEKFDEKWNFPNCIGAVDGRHCVMTAPPHSGSTYYNYKGTHSIVLMAIADAQYNFLYIDVGCNGRISDCGIFNKCSFAAAMNTNRLNLPEPCALPERTKPIPFFLVADDAFAMRENVMKPYPNRSLSAYQRLFNYRLSRARRVVENAFGILTACFRVLRSPINLDANKTTRLTLACCALHNFLLQKSSSYVTPTLVDREDAEGNLIEGEWRQIAQPKRLQDIEELPTTYTGLNAKAIREEIEQYIMSPKGEVPWQYKFI